MFQLYGPERGHRTSRELSVWLCERARDNALCSEKEVNMTTRHDTNWLFIELNRGFVVEVLSDDDWMTLCGVPESSPPLKPFARSKRSTTSIILFSSAITAANERPWQLNWNLRKYGKNVKLASEMERGGNVSRIVSALEWVIIFHTRLGHASFTSFFRARSQSLLSSVRMRSDGNIKLTPCTSRCFEIALISLTISHVSERQWDASIYWTRSIHALFERSLDRFYYRISRVARRYSLAVPTVQLGSECRRVNGWWWHSASNWVAIGIIYLLIVERIYRENSFC